MKPIGNYESQDGLRAWLTVLGVSLIFIFDVSMITTFGFMFEPIFNGSNESASMVMNLFLFVTNFTILATGFLMKNITANQFVITGSLIASFGLLLSSFVTSASQLAFTFSTIVGIGLGLLNPACFIAVLSCFTTNRSQAISIVFGALGLGQFLMPALIYYLIETIGYKASVIISGCLVLIGTFAANLLVPIKWNPTIEDDAEKQPLLNSYKLIPEIGKEIIYKADLDMLNICSCKCLRFIMIALGLALVYASSMDFLHIFPIYLKNWKNLNPTQSIICIRTIQIADIITRFTFPLITNRLKISNRNIFAIGVIMIGTIRIVLIFYANLNYESLLYICSILGAFKALTVVMHVLIIVDFCERWWPEKLPGALGLGVVLKAIVIMLMEMVFSRIREWSGLDLFTNFYSHVIIFVVVLSVWSLDFRSDNE